VVKVIWHKDASPPFTDRSIVFVSGTNIRPCIIVVSCTCARVCFLQTAPWSVQPFLQVHHGASGVTRNSGAAVQISKSSKVDNTLRRLIHRGEILPEFGAKILQTLNFLTIQCTIGERKLPCHKPARFVQPFQRSTCDRQTDRQTDKRPWLVPALA